MKIERNENGELLLFFTKREEWRDWLFDNHQKHAMAWLVNAKKASGKPAIPYNEAVEEALCVNWIDSVNKRFDKDHSLQRYSPRRKNSQYSQANVERLRWLDTKDLIHPEYKDQLRTLIEEEYSFPHDILAEIEKDTVAWKHYMSFPEGYKRIRIAYIDSARNRPDEFARRLAHFIQKSRKNILLSGYGGIEKYYYP